MAEEIYTKEELEGKTRLELRRVCKDLGMDATECSKMHYDHLVEWILENQGEGDEGTARSKKTTNKKPATTKKTGGGGKAALSAKKGGGTKKNTPKKATARKPAEPESEPLSGIEPDEDGVVTKKIDELGKVVNTNFEELFSKVDAVMEENYRLQCELYKTQGLVAHMMSWLEAADILDVGEAPEGLSTEDKLNALAEEVEGNEGGEDE